MHALKIEIFFLNYNEKTIVLFLYGGENYQSLTPIKSFAKEETLHIFIYIHTKWRKRYMIRVQ